MATIIKETGKVNMSIGVLAFVLRDDFNLLCACGGDYIIMLDKRVSEAKEILNDYGVSGFKCSTYKVSAEPIGVDRVSELFASGEYDVYKVQTGFNDKALPLSYIAGYLLDGYAGVKQELEIEAGQVRLVDGYKMMLEDGYFHELVTPFGDVYAVYYHDGYYILFRLIVSESNGACVALRNYAGLCGELNARLKFCRNMGYTMGDISFHTSECFELMEIHGESETDIMRFLGTRFSVHILENGKEKTGERITSRGITYKVAYTRAVNSRCEKCAAKSSCPKDNRGDFKCVELSTSDGSFAYFTDLEEVKTERPTLESAPVYVPFKFDGSDKVYEKKAKYAPNTFECIEEGGRTVYASGSEPVTFVETKTLKELEYGAKFLLNGKVWFKGMESGNGSFYCHETYYMSGEGNGHGDVLVTPLEHGKDEYRPVFDIKNLTINQLEVIENIITTALDMATWNEELRQYELSHLDIAISKSEYNELRNVNYEQ